MSAAPEVTGQLPQRLISVAPMMDRTDRHCRYFFRLLAPDIRLYTEMVTAQAVVRGDPDRLLTFHPEEHPVCLQLGGSDPEMLSRAIHLAEAYGYDEYNLNIGCPSDRVRSGQFGACLMLEPARVADCIRAMMAATGRPISVKTRIGVDDHGDYPFLATFVATVAETGCDTLIVHARKAILKGLSAKQNREVPPLCYETVYRLKREFPRLTIVLNGGIRSSVQVQQHLERVDGVMIGRKACSDPLFLSELQANFLDPVTGRCPSPPAPGDVVREMADYAEAQIAAGARLQPITRHMLGLFNGRPGARRWRRYISERARRLDAGAEVLRDSLSELT